MAPIDLIRSRLRALRAYTWGETCPDGLPVPERERCSHADCDSIALTELELGVPAVVSCLQEPASPASRRVASMGILPGSGVTLVQRYPAYVFRMGYAEFAVDTELAERIRVRIEP